jgi:hypothetical protein
VTRSIDDIHTDIVHVADQLALLQDREIEIISQGGRSHREGVQEIIALGERMRPLRDRRLTLYRELEQLL